MNRIAARQENGTLMISRPTRWVVYATLLTLGTGVAFAIVGLALGGPTTTAQVGVPYSSSLTALNFFTPPLTFSILSGALPTGLTLSNTSTGAITGTPTTAGAFTFTAQVTDSTLLSDPSSPSTGPDGQAAARRRKLAQSGSNAAGFSASNTFTITVAPAAPSPTPVPPSMWMAMTGLAGAGIFRLRQKRRG